LELDSVERENARKILKEMAREESTEEGNSMDTFETWLGEN